MQPFRLPSLSSPTARFHQHQLESSAVRVAGELAQHFRRMGVPELLYFVAVLSTVEIAGAAELQFLGPDQVEACSY